MTPLERLRRKDRVTALDGAGALAFLLEPAAGMLLVPGDPTRPEATDVAVVLGQLADAFPALRVGVADDGDEPAMRQRFAITAFPTLLFVKGGSVVTALARMQSWTTYEGAARALEAGR